MESLHEIVNLYMWIYIYTIMVGGTYAFVIFMLRCHKVKCKPPVYIDYNEFPSCGWAISIRNNQHSLFIKWNYDD